MEQKLNKTELDAKSVAMNSPEHRAELAKLSPVNAKAYDRATTQNERAEVEESADEDRYLGVPSPEIDPDYGYYN